MSKKSIKNISLTLALVFSISLFSAIPVLADDEPALNLTEVSLLLGGSIKKLEVLNVAEGTVITWNSSDWAVVRVSPNGFIISVSEGSANVTARVGTVTLTCAVTVYTEPLLITNDVYPKDTNGLPIFSQMGSIHQYGVDGDPYYYWYAMNFQRGQSYYNNIRVNNMATAGSTTWSSSSIRCYKSLDLVTWEPVGGPWTASGGHPADVVRPGQYGWNVVTTSWIARMGVGYNRNTKQYVMVGQYQEGAHGTNRLWYAVSDKPEGPFVFVKHEQAMTVGPDIPRNANGVLVPHTGDMTTYWDKTTGDFYVIYSINGVTRGGANGGGWEQNPERDQQYVAKLDPADFMRVVENTEVYDSKKDNYYKLEREGGREANCMFQYDGWYYYAASGLRGWNTSPSFYLGGARTAGGAIYNEDGVKTGTEYTNEVGLPNNMTAMRGSVTNFSHTTQIVGFATSEGPVTEQAPIGTLILEFGDRHADSAGYGIGPTQFAPLTFLDPATAPEPEPFDLPKTPDPKSWYSNPLNPWNRTLPAAWVGLDTFFPFLPDGYPYADDAGNPEWKRPEWPIPVYNNMTQFYYDIANSAWDVGANNNYIENAYFENDRLAGGMTMYVNLADPNWQETWRTTTAAGFTQWSYPTIQTYVNEPNGWVAEHIEGQVSQINYGGNRSTAVGNTNYQLIAPGTTNRTYYSAWAGNYAWYHGYTKRNPGTDPYVTKTYQDLKVPDGIYTFYGWVRSSGGQNEAYIYAGDHKVDISMPIGAWSVLMIDDIEVVGGQIQVGFYSDAAAATDWAFFDDFVFMAKTIGQPDLADLLGDALALNWEDYTAAGWAVLLGAIDDALAGQEDGARQADVNAAYYKLLKAMQNLAPRELVKVVPTAWVDKLNGNKNDLYITVTEYYDNGFTVVFNAKFSINNNADGTYAVGPYKVYVDTKGNVQIRDIYLVK